MDVQGVSQAGQLNYTGLTETKNSNINVDTQTFLKLLVTQMKYQDPLEPQSNTEFVTQLAQMTSLSEMQNVRAALQSSQAYDLIGRTVYAEVIDSATGETRAFAGTVDAVVMRAGTPYLVVGSALVALGDVKFIFDTPAEQPPEETEEPGGAERDAGSPQGADRAPVETAPEPEAQGIESEETEA